MSGRLFVLAVTGYDSGPRSAGQYGTGGWVGYGEGGNGRFVSVCLGYVCSVEGGAESAADIFSVTNSD